MLIDLLHNLKINYVIIVEDDFYPHEDSSDIISQLFNCNNLTKEKLFEELVPQAPLLTKWLKELVGQKSEELIRTINLSGVEAILEEDDLKKLSSFNAQIISLSEVFLKYGIFNRTRCIVYNDLIDELMKTNCVCLNTFNSGDYNTISQAIEDNIGSDKLYIAIVDKLLSADTDTNRGISLIEELRQQNNHDAKLLSVILSSQANPKQPIKYDDYFNYEISKDCKKPTIEIINSLSLAAYAVLFNNLKECANAGVDEAISLIFQTPQNIYRILKEARTEGQIPFEIIEKWYLDVFYFFFNKNIVANHDDLKLATSFYDNFPMQFSYSASSNNDLSQITSFEIFDYSINNKYLPVSVGDIFKVKDKYYVLVGQECDLSLRFDDDSDKTVNYRKTDVGVWLEASFSSNYSDEKCSCKTKGNNLSLSLYPFSERENNYGILEIFINKYKTVGFDPLDLCSLNCAGESILSLSDLSVEKFIHMPTKHKHYQEIYERLQAIIRIRRLLEKEKIDFPEKNDLADYSAFTNLEENAGQFSFPIKRIARLRNEFCRYVNQLYYNRIQRTALNTINMFPPKKNIEHECKVKLTHHGMDQNKDDINITIREELSKSSLIIPYDTILPVIGDKFKSRLKKSKDLVLKDDSYDEGIFIKVDLEKKDCKIDIPIQLCINGEIKKCNSKNIKYSQLIQAKPHSEDYLEYADGKQVNLSSVNLDIVNIFENDAIIYSKEKDEKFHVSFDEENLVLTVKGIEDE